MSIRLEKIIALTLLPGRGGRSPRALLPSINSGTIFRPKGEFYRKPKGEVGKENGASQTFRLSAETRRPARPNFRLQIAESESCAIRAANILHNTKIKHYISQE